MRLLHQKHNTASNRLHEKNAPTMGRKGNERAFFPTVSCTSRKGKSRQSSTASIGDTPNVEVEDNEIGIGIAEHEVRQEEKLGVQNEAVYVTEATVNFEGIDVATTKEGARQVNTEERLVLKRLREIFEIKVHDGTSSVKNVDWKKMKREVELVYSVITNVKTNS